MATESTPDLHITPADMRDRPNDPGHPSARALAHGSMEVRWFRPAPDTRHEPHDRDEIYVVVSGTAKFRRDNESGAFEEARLCLSGRQTVPVSPGDVLFVPAGSLHDFDDTSPDFAVWAVFYGPEGGESP